MATLDAGHAPWGATRADVQRGPGGQPEGAGGAAAPPLRARTLGLSTEHVSIEHIRSEKRRLGRQVSREKVVLAALVQTRALVVDVAEALDIDERGASRACKGRDPFDVGDVLAIARSGPGGLRLARRLIALLSAQVDAIEFHD